VLGRHERRTGHTCPSVRDVNFAGALSATGTTFTVALADRAKLAHINVIYCCC
jgi:hypothetical protein